MSLLSSYVEKFGKIRGRKEYNAYFREYRKRNNAKMRKYDKDRRAAQKLNNNGPSSVL
jgi:hypothetical protein